MIETAKLFEMCPELDAALITSQKNRNYFTGFSSTFGFLIITRDQKVYITDARYGEMATEALVPNNIKVVVANGADVPLTIAKTLADAGAKIVGYEDTEATVVQLNRYKTFVGDCQLVEMGKAIAELKRIKAPHEIELITKAQSITDKAFTKILGMIKPDITEIDIAVELEYLIRKNGGDGIAFDIIVASGANASKPHAHPTSKKIKNGDIITLDFGAKVGGYCSDMTRTFFLGKPDEQLKNIYNLVLKAQLNVLKNVKCGMTCAEMDALAREMIVANGYGDNFQHGLGHGLGVDIHEAPSISALSVDTLQENMVVTVEPGIYVSGLGGVRIEDLIIIKEDSIINLTTSNKDIIIL